MIFLNEEHSYKNNNQEKINVIDFSKLNDLPTEVKTLIVTGQSLIDAAEQTLKDRYCGFDLTSKRQLKSDCVKVEKCIQKFYTGKMTEKNIQQLETAVTCLDTSYKGLKAFFSR